MNFPNKYPRCLYNVTIEFGAIDRNVLATSPEDALEQLKMNSGIVTPVKSYKYINDFGHQKTHDYFKSFGEKWVVTNGAVYFQ